MQTVKSLALFIASAILLTACSSPVKLSEPAKVEERAPEKVADKPTVATVVAPTVDPLNDPKGILAKRSVYFDLDSYVVKDEFKGLVEAHAKYLSSNKSRKILIQGNTDERGGREYNLALGQKRAEAVRKALSALGVSESQIEAVSLGKEKATGTDEASWAKDRRSDIVY